MAETGCEIIPLFFATRNDIFVVEIIPPEITPLAFRGVEKLSRVYGKLSRLLLQRETKQEALIAQCPARQARAWNC